MSGIASKMNEVTPTNKPQLMLNQDLEDVKEQESRGSSSYSSVKSNSESNYRDD
jgi:hypothetical protein